MRSTDRTATAGPAAPPANAEPGPHPDHTPPSWPRIDSELAAELHGGPWRYPWRFAPGIEVPTADPLARQMAWAREAMIEPYALDGLALGDARIALDLDCGEGRLAHRLLDWGARRVVAVTADPESLHRATLLRRHLAIDPAALDLVAAEDLEPATEPEFDVVLAVPRGDDEAAIEAAGARCRGIAAFECADADANRVAAAALAAGFASVERVKPPVHAPAPFLLDEHEILIARAERRS